MPETKNFRVFGLNARGFLDFLQFLELRFGGVVFVQRVAAADQAIAGAVVQSLNVRQMDFVARVPLATASARIPG